MAIMKDFNRPILSHLHNRKDYLRDILLVEAMFDIFSSLNVSSLR